MTNAWIELNTELRPGEKLEAILLGMWGHGFVWDNPYSQPAGFDEPPLTTIPPEHQNALLAPETARQYMLTWKISGGFGSPDCFAMTAWSTERVFFISEYDGATGLSYLPRSPALHPPTFFGGG